jgi:hypothetical protein
MAALLHHSFAVLPSDAYELVLSLSNYYKCGANFFYYEEIHYAITTADFRKRGNLSEFPGEILGDAMHYNFSWRQQVNQPW